VAEFIPPSAGRSIAMWTVYILKSTSTGRFYIGCTGDLERRLHEHNTGHTLSTKSRGPWSVVYSELFDEQNSAYAREKQIKKYKGGNAFRALIDK
jgi:putative endonuclease